MAINNRYKRSKSNPCVLTGGEGFTLIELIMVIVLLGIVAATAVVMIGNVITTQRTDETFREVQNLVNAMVGNPELFEGGMRSSFGYAGDMGPLPPATGTCSSTCGSCGLVELVNQCGRPSWTADPQLPGTGWGWRGPYIDAKTDDSNRYLALLDGWGNYYTYNATTGQITSYGPDGVVGGGDDIVWPGSALQSNGTVTGRVTDINGNPVTNTAGCVTITNIGCVTITHPNPASPGNSTTTTVATDTNGVFTFSGNIPIGKHKIQTTVSGTTYTKAMTVLPNQSVAVDFSAGGDPTTPNPPTAVTATRATLSSINLTWTAPTTNTDGSTLIDLAGYRIDRSLDGATYSILQTIGLGTSFTNTLLTAGQRYFYRMRAVDKSGNQSADSTVSSTTVSPITQTGAAATFSTATGATCGYALAGTPRVDFSIRNRGAAGDTGANITVTTVTISWSGGGGIRVVDSPAGAPYSWSSATPVGSPANITLTTPFTINAGVSQTMRLCFSTSRAITDAITLQMNTADGQFTLY